MREHKNIVRNLIQLHRTGYFADVETYRKVIANNPNLSTQDIAGIFQAFDAWIDARANGPKLTLVSK